MRTEILIPLALAIALVRYGQGFCGNLGTDGLRGSSIELLELQPRPSGRGLRRCGRPLASPTPVVSRALRSK